MKWKQSNLYTRIYKCKTNYLLACSGTPEIDDGPPVTEHFATSFCLLRDVPFLTSHSKFFNWEVCLPSQISRLRCFIETQKWSMNIVSLGTNRKKELQSVAKNDLFMKNKVLCKRSFRATDYILIVQRNIFILYLKQSLLQQGLRKNHSIRFSFQN